MFDQPFDPLLGRRTHEIFAAHWPYAEGGADDFIAKRFNSVTTRCQELLKVSAGRSALPIGMCSNSQFRAGDSTSGTPTPASSSAQVACTKCQEAI